MEDIIIPSLDIKLSSVVRRMAQNTISVHLSRNDLGDLRFRPADGQTILNYINADYVKVQGRNDKLLFVSLLLIHLESIVQSTAEIPSKANPDRDTEVLTTVADLQYDLHAEITNLGFKIDDNQFTSKEVSDLNSKVNEILSKLDELKGGHEVLFERIEELKDDFTDIQTTIPLGKKTTVQRLSGVIVPYIGQKGADEVYNVISPIIKAAIKQHLPTLIG
jgi:CHASE3 domain sensor protein